MDSNEDVRCLLGCQGSNSELISASPGGRQQQRSRSVVVMLLYGKPYSGPQLVTCLIVPRPLPVKYPFCRFLKQVCAWQPLQKSHFFYVYSQLHILSSGSQKPLLRLVHPSLLFTWILHTCIVNVSIIAERSKIIIQSFFRMFLLINTKFIGSIIYDLFLFQCI